MNDNYKRKLQALALASTIMLSLTGCKNENNLSETNNDEIKYQQEETLNRDGLHTADYVLLSLLAASSGLTIANIYEFNKSRKKQNNNQQNPTKIKKRTK